jgi:hypothetical protein
LFLVLFWQKAEMKGSGQWAVGSEKKAKGKRQRLRRGIREIRFIAFGSIFFFLVNWSTG